MKFIKQISTGKIVYRESPHRVDSKVLGNASISTKIPLEDLQVADEPLSEKQYAEAIQNQRPYDEKRKAEYPPMTDYLDGIVKGDQAQIDKYIADCLAVKEKYPKGEN